MILQTEKCSCEGSNENMKNVIFDLVPRKSPLIKECLSWFLPKVYVILLAEKWSGFKKNYQFLTIF